MKRWLIVLLLRARIGLLRYERALRLDAMLEMYGAAPDSLTDQTVRDVLRDVDAEIAVARAELAGYTARRSA